MGTLPPSVPLDVGVAPLPLAASPPSPAIGVAEVVRRCPSVRFEVSEMEG